MYAAFRETGTIFCSCSGPRLPDVLVRTGDDVYLRLHGPERWYRHNYSRDELAKWADRIKASGAKRAWIYFNNNSEGYAPKNALTMRRLLSKRPSDDHPGSFRREGQSRVIAIALNNHGILTGAGTSFGLARCPVMRTTAKILCICGVILLMFAPRVYSSLSGAEAPIQTSLVE